MLKSDTIMVILCILAVSNLLFNLGHFCLGTKLSSEPVGRIKFNTRHDGYLKIRSLPESHKIT